MFRLWVRFYAQVDSSHGSVSQPCRLSILSTTWGLLVYRAPPLTASGDNKTDRGQTPKQENDHTETMTSGDKLANMCVFKGTYETRLEPTATSLLVLLF